MVTPRAGRHSAIPIAFFSRINSNYDVDESLPKPKKRWEDEARCRTTPIRYRNIIFFPKPGGSNPYKLAKMYCQNCPVKDDCLAAAIKEEAGAGRRQMIGMRGGKTPTERYELIREYKAKGLFTRKSNTEAIRRLARFENHSRSENNPTIARNIYE